MGWVSPRNRLWSATYDACLFMCISKPHIKPLWRHYICTSYDTNVYITLVTTTVIYSIWDLKRWPRQEIRKYYMCFGNWIIKYATVDNADQSLLIYERIYRDRIPIGAIFQCAISRGLGLHREWFTSLLPGLSLVAPKAINQWYGGLSSDDNYLCFISLLWAEGPQSTPVLDVIVDFFFFMLDPFSPLFLLPFFFMFHSMPLF